MRFLSNFFRGGLKGAIGSHSVSISSGASTPAGAGGMTIGKGGLPIEWESVLGGSAGADSAKLSRPYAQSVWVSAAIGFVAQPITAVPLVFSRDKRGGDVVVDDAALTAFWEKPAKTKGGAMGRADMLEATVMWLSLRGESFWIMDDTWLKPRAKKSPLIVARPDDMRPILEAGSRELKGWLWTSGDGQRIPLIPEQVVHLKYANPYDECRGLAKWEAAKIAADADYAAGVFARNLNANNGDRGPYVIAKGGMPSDDQQKQITAMLRMKREMSRRGDFRGVFLAGDVDVKEPGLQSVDAAYIAARVENRHEIYAAFGVPMSFAEVMASYSIGSASDRFRLIEDTCQPLGAKICDGVEQVSAMLLGYAVFAEFDWDEHSTMQAVRGERIDSAVKLVERGMPWATASDYLRLKLPRFPGDDVGRVPFNLQEIESGKPKDEPPPPKEEDPIGELEKLFRLPAPGAMAKGGCPCCTPAAKATGDKKPHAGWAAAQAKRKPWVKKLHSVATRLLMDARAETLRKLAEAVAADEAKSIGKGIDVLGVMFDLGTWLPEWIKGLTHAERAMMEQAGFELWSEELGKDDPLVMPAEKVKLAITLRENRLRNAGADIWERVRRDLQKAVNEGRPNNELAGAVKASFQGISDQRALAIAQTETTVVYETGRDLVFREAGVQWTQWLHSGLEDGARPTHQAAHLQIRELGEPFDIGGVPMMFPGDPDAPADEVIHCHCVRVAVSGPNQSDIEGNDNDDIPY